MSPKDIIDELMGIILTNPSAAQKALITNFLNARKADSEAIETAAPDISSATIAQQDAPQAELTTLTGDL